ncbi:MAG: sterol desaturase family protein, partial [Methylotenera sp.]|nr:sterol desaturase family protein [Flavobacterium sp.]
MILIKQVFDYGGAPILALVFIGLFIAEGRSQLRKRKQERSKRIIINTIGSIPAFTLLRFLFLPIMVKLAIKNQHFKFGLNYRYNANPIVKGIVAFLIMDYTNYLWHILNHKLPFLWRFHVVHHSNPDLDLSTALRFHFGEMIGSVFYRGAFVLVSGASALQVLLY